MNSSSIISQQLLEQNEDIIAAVVENLQLGRLDDCIKHYSILQSNLIAFALELDNFPGNSDAYEALPGFPDEIMRKDILEDLQPHGTRTLPEPPLIPPCVYCIETGQYSSEVCRLQSHHVDPSSKFSFLEREEFMQATQVIASRNRLGSMDANSKSKRLYKIWNSNEKYSMLLAVAEYGNKNIPQIASIMETRSENQIRSYIQKHLRDEAQIPRKQDILRKVPKGYQPPPGLAHLFNPEASDMTGGGSSSSSSSAGGGGGYNSFALQSQQQQQQHQLQSVSHQPPSRYASSSSSSSLAPQQGRNDWSSLLSLAAGVIVPSVHVTSSGQIHHTFPSSGATVVTNIPSSNLRNSSSSNGGSSSSSSSSGRGITTLPAPAPPLSQPTNIPVLQLPSLSANIPTSSLPPPPLEAPTTLADPLREIVAETKRLEEESRNRTYYATQLALSSGLSTGSGSGGSGAVGLLGARVNSGMDGINYMSSKGSSAFDQAGSSMPPPAQKRRVEPPPFARPGIAKLKMQRQQQQQQQQQHHHQPPHLFDAQGGGLGLMYMQQQQQQLLQGIGGGGVMSGSHNNAMYYPNNGGATGGGGGMLNSSLFFNSGSAMSHANQPLHSSVVSSSGSGAYLEPHEVLSGSKKGVKAAATAAKPVTTKRPYKGRKGGAAAAAAEGGSVSGSETRTADKTQTSDAHSARYNFDLSDLCSSPNKEMNSSAGGGGGRGKVRKYNAVGSVAAPSTSSSSSSTGGADAGAGAVVSGGVSLFSAATNLTSNRKRPPLPPNTGTTSSSAASAAHAYVPVDPEISMHGQDSCLLLEIDDNCSLFN